MTDFSRFTQGSKASSKPEDLTPLIVLRGGQGVHARDFKRSEAANTRVFKHEDAQIEAAESAAREQQAGLRAQMDSLAAEVAKGFDITLDRSQLHALNGVLRNKCAVLIGAAGTGKTTLERYFLKLLHERAKAEGRDPPKIAIMAFTGRAAQQSRRVIPQEYAENVSTIHAGLGFKPEWYDVEVTSIISGARETTQRMKFTPTYDATNKLPFDYVIIDEASMVPVPLWNQLIAACKADCHFILVGDIHQLPPVGSKSILGYAMRKWPVYELTQIHRQAEGNPIIENAHRVLHGQFPFNAETFSIIGTSDGVKAGGKPVIAPAGIYETQCWFIQHMRNLWQKEIYQPYRDAIIVPKKIDTSPLSTTCLNQFFVPLFNPPKLVGGMIVNPRTQIHSGTGRCAYAVGDKVLIMNNINTVIPPITNGMTGVVESLSLNGRYDTKRNGIDLSLGDSGSDTINEAMEELDEMYSSALDDFADTVGEVGVNDKASKEDQDDEQRQSSHVMTIRFDNGQEFVASTAGDYAKITFGYAITCHKAQGGEYPHVFILVHSGDAAGNLLTREWLYTAVTRARERVFLFCNKAGLQRALSVQKIAGQTLGEKIRAFNAAAKTEDDLGFPQLPQNVETD